MKDNLGPLNEMLEGRKNVFELVIVAVVLSTSIGLLTGSIVTIEDYNPIVGIIVGIIIIGFSLIYLNVKLMKSLKRSQVLSGFFIFDSKDNMIVPVFRHRLSESMSRNIKAVFSENKAIEHIWNTDRIDTIWDRTSGKLKRITPKSSKLVHELVEYYLLDRLSTHLNDYFNNDSLDNKELYNFSREEIPDVLLSNRVLEMFSKRMEDRPQFVEIAKTQDSDHGKIVSCSGNAGASFQEFDLILPKGSKVSRASDGSIQIKTKRFTMSITVMFDGLNTFVAPYFMEDYVGMERNYGHEYKIDTKIDVVFSITSLFRRSGWEYYHWIDSFLDSIEHSISEKVFLKDIDWESNLTLLHTAKISRRKKEII